jgi:hypothetical protein
VAEWTADGERNGHYFPVGDGYWFPCRGCGVDGPFSPLGSQPCPKPYTPPEAIGKKLDRIIHLLEVLCGLRQ